MHPPLSIPSALAMLAGAAAIAVTSAAVSVRMTALGPLTDDGESAAPATAGTAVPAAGPRVMAYLIEAYGRDGEQPDLYGALQ